MSNDPVHFCSSHERIASDISRNREWLGELQTDLDDHCRVNGGGGPGHVTRREFDKLERLVEDIRGAALKVIVGVLVVSAGGSALGPTIKLAILELLH